jgi:acetylornithine aminotransferase/acetylornithine/N-succinyldiaminopimelate aminotransferase
VLRRFEELPVYERLGFGPVLGRGCELWDADGRRMLDLYAGHAVALTGHCHPHVVEAIRRQSEALTFYSNALPLESRDRLVARLGSLAPPRLDRVLLVSSGAEANEQALALSRRATGRTTIVTVEGGFHGRTLATLSASGIERYRALAHAAGGETLLAATRVCPFDDADALDEMVDDQVAALIVEPIQGLAGARDLSSRFLLRARQACDRAGAALIFDEVQCGCGRIGAFTAAQALEIVPDALTLAKGIASGLPLGALLVGSRLAEGIRAGDLGTTFGGGPIPCAAAEATLAVLERERLAERAGEIGSWLRRSLPGLSGVERLLGRGLMMGIVLDRPAKPVQLALFERGLLVGTSSEPHTLRLLPPLVIEERQIARFVEALSEVLR